MTKVYVQALFREILMTQKLLYKFVEVPSWDFNTPNYDDIIDDDVILFPHLGALVLCLEKT